MKFKDVEFSSLTSHLLLEKKFIDVRAPIEYAEGSLPGAVNLPIMNDEERARVGTCYKHSGREAAIQLGHKIVSNENRDFKIQSWRQLLETNPDSVFYCARGGLRSKISADWIAELEIPGLELRRLMGGFKESRQQILNYFSEFTAKHSLILLTGMTGSAKTHVLQALALQVPALDLEGVAHHRGSAFGAWEIPQPRQINFENKLYIELLKLENRFSTSSNVNLAKNFSINSNLNFNLVLEDESRTIGLCVIPEGLFQKMRASPVVIIEEPLETRVENVFKDYVLNTAIGRGSQVAAIQVYERYKKSLLGIQRKLGGQRTIEILRDLQQAENEWTQSRQIENNRIWIEKLLRYYYDPMYSGSLAQRAPHVLFRGRRSEVEDYLRQTLAVV